LRPTFSDHEIEQFLLPTVVADLEEIDARYPAVRP